MTIYNVIPDMRLVMFSEAVAASILGLFPANRLRGEKSIVKVAHRQQKTADILANQSNFIAAIRKRKRRRVELYCSQLKMYRN
jgi:hypothetical protein